MYNIISIFQLKYIILSYVEFKDLKRIRHVSRYYNELIKEIFRSRLSLSIRTNSRLKPLKFLQSYLHELKFVGLHDKSTVFREAMVDISYHNSIQVMHINDCPIDDDVLFENLRKMTFLKKMHLRHVKTEEFNFIRLLDVTISSLTLLSLRSIDVGYTVQYLNGYKNKNNNNITLENLSMKFDKALSFLQMESVVNIIDKLRPTLKLFSVTFQRFLEDELEWFQARNLNYLESIDIDIDQTDFTNLYSSLKNMVTYLNMISGQGEDNLKDSIHDDQIMYKQLRKIKVVFEQYRLLDVEYITSLDFTNLYHLEVS